MKAIRQVSDNLSVEVEGKNTEDLIRSLAQVDETFEDTRCGKCESKWIKFVVRKVDNYEFFELWCKKCFAKLSFGNNGETLYPKRLKTDAKGKSIKGEDGKAIKLPDNGWLKYNKETGEHV